MRCLGLLVLLLSLVPRVDGAAPPAPQRVLFDFETDAEVEAWSELALPGSKGPPIQRARVAAHATSGKHSLKLTFAGGTWPTITTTRVPGDWFGHPTFEADVRVERPCVVGFTVLQEKSARGGGWDALVSRWTKTAFLRPGTNRVAAPLPQPNQYALHPKWGKVARFEVFVYRPRPGESIHLDNVRLTNTKVPPRPTTRFTLAGTDVVLTGTTSAQAVIELGKRMKDRWKPPVARTVEQVEADFRKRYAELKARHPRAVLAVLRDGEKGHTGWRDAYWNSHGPDGAYEARAENRGKSASHEVFMRHRSPLMRVDLSSIPTGSTILAAQLLIVRANPKYLDDHNPEKKATMWVVEPCNRPWQEYEVNAFEYARDRYWKDVGGMDWGEDGDFATVFLAHGPGQGRVNTWDFTEAVRYWTDGRRPNHGFMLHGDSHDYLIAHSREAKERADRPAVLVVYEPALPPR